VAENCEAKEVGYETEHEHCGEVHFCYDAVKEEQPPGQFFFEEALIGEVVVD